MSKYTNEIEKRRTFAIISHPDAGKTTLTEKFLLYGGAINLAGSVKGKATARHAVSDWMEIEKERGISESTQKSVQDSVQDNGNSGGVFVGEYKPHLKMNLIQMTLPDKPNSRNQRYIKI